MMKSDSHGENLEVSYSFKTSQYIKHLFINQVSIVSILYIKPYTKHWSCFLLIRSSQSIKLKHIIKYSLKTIVSARLLRHWKLMTDLNRETSIKLRGQTKMSLLWWNNIWDLKDSNKHVFVRKDEGVKLWPVVFSIARVLVFYRQHFTHFMLVIKDICCISGVQGARWSLTFWAKHSYDKKGNDRGLVPWNQRLRWAFLCSSYWGHAVRENGSEGSHMRQRKKR